MSLNSALREFPGTNAGHASALLLILSFGIIVDVRLSRGLPFPDGYDAWLIFLATLAGLSTGGMIGKRITDVSYKAAGTPPVTVGGPSTVTVEAPAPPASPFGTGIPPVPPIPPDADKR
jgi:hypothetical protein